jgi:pimeloyl-ACP methyl ester carboxylesterase
MLTTRLLCPEIDKFNARVVGLVYDAASTEQEHVAATRECHDRLVKEGVDLAAYNTTENLADFADLRTALGKSQWNVYGTSYGTDLALTYMRQHPQGIRSVVIDSVFPPDLGVQSTTWKSVKEAQDNTFAACKEQPACAQRYPDLAGTFTRQVSDLEAKPVTTQAPRSPGTAPVKVVIDGGALVQWFLGIGALPAVIPDSIDSLAKATPRRSPPCGLPAPTHPARAPTAPGCSTAPSAASGCPTRRSRRS